MNRFLKLVYSNKFFALLMLIIQAFVILITYRWLNEYYWFFHTFIVLCSLFISIREINKTTEPGFKLAWITLIAFLPIFGILLYFFIHLLPVTNEMRKNYDSQQKITSSYLKQDDETFKKLSDRHLIAPGLSKYLRIHSGSPIYEDTFTSFYGTGEEAFEVLLEDLKKAKSFIFMEFFIINHAGTLWNEIFEILKEKAQNGVEVRVMYDGMGCLTTLPKNYDLIFKAAGIKHRIFSPITPLVSTYQNNRDHRKICVVDGKIAYTGGINIADEYANRIKRFGYWKDCAIRFEGEAVAGFTAMFLNMWNSEEAAYCDNYQKYIDASKKEYSDEPSGFIIPFGTCPLDSIAVGKRVYIDNLNNAKHYVHIMSPYLVIDSEMYETMRYAAQRGIDVKLILPHIPDKKYAFYLARSYYTELLKAGIKIYEYTPGFVHAKLSIADGNRAVVGTINHDYRSLYLHYECAAYLLDVPEIFKIEEDFKNTLNQCQEITLEKCKKYPLYQRIFGRVARIIAPLI